MRKELERSFCKFYDQSLSYLNRWFGYLEQLDEISWLNLGDSFSYKAIDASFKKLVGKEAAARDQLYKEFVEVQKNLQVLREKEEFSTSGLPQKWARLFKSKNIVQLRRLVSALLSVFASNAYRESVFSIMKDVWSPEKSRLHVSTLNALVSIKCNASLRCSEAFHHFLKCPELIKKARGNDKYAD